MPKYVKEINGIPLGASGGGGGTWGTILGTLSTQSDLQVALDSKQFAFNEVTDTSKRNALKLATNWVNPNDAGDTLYYKMTLNLPTGQVEHDYYIGIDVSTNTAYRYIYEKIDSVLSWVRIPLQISISGL